MFFELLLQGQSWIRKLHVINGGLNFKTHLKIKFVPQRKDPQTKTITLLLNKTFCYYLQERKINFLNSTGLVFSFTNIFLIF